MEGKTHFQGHEALRLAENKTNFESTKSTTNTQKLLRVIKDAGQYWKIN